MRKGQAGIPKLGAQIADTHAHLVMLDDPAGALERATTAGVMFVVTVADATETPRATYDSLPTWHEEAQHRLEQWAIPHGEPPSVRIVVGVHPHNASDFTEESAEEIVALAKDPRTVALGEIGLDFHYDHSPRDTQRDVFRRQLAMAQDLDLPAVIHLREAFDEGAAILQEIGIPDAGCVLHCFTADVPTMQRFVDLGCHISIPGVVTFSKAEDLRKAAAAVPLDRLLVETDCPFLAPEPFRGRTNEPAWVTFAAATISELRSEDELDVALALMENARRVFRDAAPGGI